MKLLLNIGAIIVSVLYLTLVGTPIQNGDYQSLIEALGFSGWHESLNGMLQSIFFVDE